MSIQLNRNLFFLILLVLTPISGPVFGQDAPGRSPAKQDTAEDAQSDTASQVPDKVSVETVVEDEDIETRLERILAATDWFESPRVTVDEGVVFLGGITDEADHSTWAAQLAGATEDVVAVVNRIEVTEPPLWNIAPA